MGRQSMGTVIRRTVKGLAVAALLSGLSNAARAADMPAPAPVAPAPMPAVEGWTFSMNLYGWASGLEGTLRTLPPLPAVDVNIGFDQVIKNLDGALMGTMEVGYGRFFVFGDLIASKLSPDKDFTRPNVEGSISLDSSAIIGTGLAGFRFLDNGQLEVDGLAGVRVFSMDNTLDVTLNRVTVSYGKDAQWVDAVGGFRIRYKFDQNWTAVLIALGGGGSSDYEWDLFGGVGYRFSERWGAFAGYRALKVDYQSGNYIYNALQHGPVLGVNIRF
jgi:hypothetical protein